MDVNSLPETVTRHRVGMYVASFSSRNQATVDSDTTPDPELHPDGTV